MPLTHQEVEEIRAQLRDQVNHLPPQQKEAALAQINSMSPQALEELVNQQRSSNENSDNKTIYRMIVDKEVPSVKVDENSKAIAVLEINPLSDGHTLVIPKEAVKKKSDLPKEAKELAKKISDILTSNFKAKTVHIEEESKFGEIIINVFASYDKEITLSSPREKKNTPTLEEVAKKFLPEQKKEVIKLTKEPSQPTQIQKIPRKIP